MILAPAALLSCTPAAAPPPPVPIPSVTASATAVVSAAAPPVENRPVLDPQIAAAVARVNRTDVERDLRALAITRHHRGDPKGLAFAAGYVEKELAYAGYAVTKQNVVHDGATSPNVIGERKGSEGDRIVVVCAHYDAVEGGPGADDNASAVAGMLAVARAVAAAKTKATLRFIGFAFEEEGLVGAFAYTKALADDERARIAGVLDLEMIGFTSAEQRLPPGVETFTDDPIPERGDFVGVVGLSGLPAPAEALRAAKPYVSSLPVAILQVPKPALLLLPDLSRSDHAPFWLAGVPAVMVTDTANFRNPHYHRKTDTIATIDFDFATKVSQLVAAATLVLAEPVR